ncbi:hypothetical protein [Clostridium thailandense]|uniref:hypothetical protein n=1 Tax=Clostridium thailandense TaxID=2794346 RepID=UPI001FE77CAD|nr:hypothetical protein [Clostridium thailandense]
MTNKFRIQILGIVAGIVISFTSLTGCGKVGDTISLIQAPMLLSSKQDDLDKTLKKILMPDDEYVYPKNAEKKQAIFIEDIDQDGKPEAFILYRDMKENRQAQLLMLKELDGKWNKVFNIETNLNAIDYFSLKDLDGSGNKEVIFGASASDSDFKKQLFIYEWDGKALIKKVDRTYEYIDIDDYNEDKKLDILILDGEINKLQSAEMLSYEKGQLKSRALVDLNPDGVHENVVSGKLADGKKALFIDSALGAHSMLTEIVSYDNGKLVKVGNEKDGVLFKAYSLYSRDINKDGITEVGGMYIPKGFEDAAMAEIPFIYIYADYYQNGTKQVTEERYMDKGQHFYITIPAKWRGKLTIQKLDKGVKLVDNKDKKILFEVRWANKESYNEAKTKLGETKNTIFYNNINKELYIENNNFHLLEDEF